ncbi:NAD(P)-binding protein [Sporormia fimetaria CBS 119925]|uniref:NAD(P)-binding protein n=1 Tax=Sporormia fimetaria CBS 119925 TaxID=1340428 RepID=A0A6A6UYW6_9PLEO|nr:NAD(P)-binding protein [Sporormia fimetaria CBS 119925]
MAMSVAGIDKLYLNDMNEERLQETKKIVEELKLDNTPEIILHPADVSCPLDMGEMFKKIDRLDYAINCAATLGPTKPILEMSLSEFDNLTDVNYRGAWICMKEELKCMLKNDIRPYKAFGLTAEESEKRGQRGAIVNITSKPGVFTTDSMGTYKASEAALTTLTKAIERDYGTPDRRIRVNAVCPGVVDTPSSQDLNKEQGEEMDRVIKNTPVGRLGFASEVADVVVFLCSGESSFIAGCDLYVDGGHQTT